MLNPGWKIPDWGICSFNSFIGPGCGVVVPPPGRPAATLTFIFRLLFRQLYFCFHLVTRSVFYSIESPEGLINPFSVVCFEKSVFLS